MKNNLSGNVTNEMEVLERSVLERLKATNNLAKFKAIESERKAFKLYAIMNGYVTVFEAKKKTKKNK